jgi:hypothetical protein
MIMGKVCFQQNVLSYFNHRHARQPFQQLNCEDAGAMVWRPIYKYIVAYLLKARTVEPEK